MNRYLRSAVLGMAALLLFAGCSSTSSNKGAAPSTLALRAGVNDPKDTTVAVLSYLPSSATVKVGATVKWTATGPEPHTISFLPSGQARPAPGSAAAIALQAPKPPTGPFDGTQTVSSGLGPTSPAPMTFSLTFSKAGTYTYFCAIHAAMQGTITVTSDTSKADTQLAATQRGQQEETSYEAEGEAAKQKLLSTPLQKKKNADGTTTWTVLMGAATAHTAVLTFQPAGPSIKAGDHVEFINDSGEPHTASFAFGVPVPQIPEAPNVMKASGKSPLRLGTKGFFNSGWLLPDAPPGAGPPLALRSFTFIVPKAGSFNFFCALHIRSGMGGSIKAT
jgi:plastocyanin